MYDDTIDITPTPTLAEPGHIYNERFRRLISNIQSTTDINHTLVQLRDKITDFFNAELVTIYLVDRRTNEVFSKVKTGGRPGEIRVPISMKSIAGYVAMTAEPVNIRNVYDARELAFTHPALHFDRTWDGRSRFTSRQVLTIPVMGRSCLIGIIQLVNKRNGDHFSSEDEKHLQKITRALSAAFQKQYRLKVRIPPQFEQLLDHGIIDEYNLGRARKMMQNRRRLEEILVSEFNVDQRFLCDSLARYFGVPYDNLHNPAYRPKELMEGISLDYFKNSGWIPVSGEDGLLRVAMINPDDQDVLQEIRSVFRHQELELRFTFQEDINRLIAGRPPAEEIKEAPAGKPATGPVGFEPKMRGKELRTGNRVMDPPEECGEQFDDRNVVRIVNKIIEEAYRQGASDIHLEPGLAEEDAVVRYRIDGRCIQAMRIPKLWIRAVVSRFKILSNLDISERRKPQDGKIKFRTTSGKNIELRVATVPTAETNEDMVLRVLADGKPLPLNKIMPRQTFERFRPLIIKPYGIVLVVGPTGSGKTTTLHSALGYINKPDRKIWTAEDPVEITQAGLRQVQVNPKIGYNFAAAMRAFLRADPDVIMVEEMRDQETVAMGIEASLTGHLVFSTLHTNSAPETITRLIDMGMDPFNFADALLGILAQRLVRTTCPACRQPYSPRQNEYDHLLELYGAQRDTGPDDSFPDNPRLYRARGCEKCDKSGYKGRLGLYELLANSDAMKELIIDRAVVDKVRRLATAEGMVSLLQDGINRILEGYTDLNQVLSVCAK